MRQTEKHYVRLGREREICKKKNEINSKLNLKGRIDNSSDLSRVSPSPHLFGLGLQHYFGLARELEIADGVVHVAEALVPEIPHQLLIRCAA